MQQVNIFWFRRDLRLCDNAGLYFSLKENLPVIPIFIFDKVILDQLGDKRDRRVEFIRNALVSIQGELQNSGSSLEVYYGTPVWIFIKLTNKYNIQTVFANHDYEPYAIERDKKIEELLQEKKIGFKTYKDQVIFEKNEILKDDGKPYTIYTPYSKKWKLKLNKFYLKSYSLEKYQYQFYKQSPVEIPSLNTIGFEATGEKFPSGEPNINLIGHYNETRDFPAKDGTSRLGVHLRFGTISIRDLVTKAKTLNEIFLNELIWREFYMSILWHFPHVGHHQAFKREYDNIQWRNNEKEFEKWCKGETGFPIVDAGMRELNETGFMHNRIRMIAGSFLCKDLLVDWRWGEAYFASRLLDFDFASNNGGWQWVAGSGCDAAPYFRIFNPELQTKKFDRNLEYISKWVPEFRKQGYAKSIVDHSYARERCLAAYKTALTQNRTYPGVF